MNVTQRLLVERWGNTEVQAFVLAARETPAPSLPEGQEAPLLFSGYSALFFADATGRTALLK